MGCLAVAEWRSPFLEIPAAEPMDLLYVCEHSYRGIISMICQHICAVHEEKKEKDKSLFLSIKKSRNLFWIVHHVFSSTGD